MNNVFEKVDKENAAEIKKLRDNIANAEAKIEKLTPLLHYDTDLEKFSNTSIKVDAYKNFIEKNNEQIEHIVNNPYSEDDCIKQGQAIQKEYNSKFKKIYTSLYNQMEKICSEFETYREAEESFISDRDNLNATSNALDTVVNIYDGEGIKNDNYSEYEQTIYKLKSLLESYPVE